ncbi:MAG: NrpR regulatory domain-containing protein [bacterium]|nr:NrpR regulatory domain-containing protein [bacterium]
MREINQKQKIAILSILRDAREPVGSDAIAKDLHQFGYDLSSRTIRLYLQEMEEEGLVTPARRGRDGGRTITLQGSEEIRDALVKDRVGYTASKVDMLACQCTFDPTTRQGVIALNITLIDTALLLSAIHELTQVFTAGLGMGDYVYIARAGERVGNFYIPPGKVGIGTICSVTLNGILLRARIPIISCFGGVLEIQDKTPIRFTDIIYYNGTSLDPLEIFIKGGLTQVRSAARLGNGRIGAGFREIPTVAVKKTLQVLQQLKTIGIGGIALVGKPNHALLGFPVEDGRTALIVNGGLNPTAALEEAGIPTSNYALCTLFEFSQMIHYKELTNIVLEKDY